MFRARDVVNAYKFSITQTKCTAQVQVCRLSLSFVSGQAHYWLPSSDVAYRKWIRVCLVWLSPSNWVCGWPAVRLSVKLLFPYALWRFVSPMMRDVEQSEKASGSAGSIERHPKCLTVRWRFGFCFWWQNKSQTKRQRATHKLCKNLFWFFGFLFPFGNLHVKQTGNWQLAAASDNFVFLTKIGRFRALLQIVKLWTRAMSWEGAGKAVGHETRCGCPRLLDALRFRSRIQYYSATRLYYIIVR